MSLFDAFLRDSLLDTVVQSGVNIAIRTDGAPGAGTEEDPFDGSSAAKLDALFGDSTKLPAGSTIHLGPGSFSTGGSAVWHPLDRWRIVGSGIDATTLKVVSAPEDSFTAAIGPSSTYLNSFEASDFTIDCDLTHQPTLTNNHSRAVGGIAVSGKNVLLRRIRVINFGNASSGSPSVTNTCYALSAAMAAASALPYNCVIDHCEVTTPAGQAGKPVIALHLGSTGGAPIHTSCAIRNCWVDLAIGGAADFGKDLRALSVYCGAGTIVEGNRIYNCKNGGPYYDGTEASLPTTAQAVTDLVVRENYYYNVQFGVYFSTSASTGNVGRVVIDRNVFELEQTASGPIGVKLDGGSRSSPPGVFTQAIIRGNCIRPADGAADTQSTIGVTLKSVDQAVVEDNVISVATANNAVTHVGCDKFKSFNNQSPQGVILPGYNSGASIHDAELTTDVEDALLNL